MPVRKKCKKCKKTKPLSQFYKHPNNADGHMWSCKLCQVKKVQLWTKKNQERRKKYLEEYREKNRERIRARKLESKFGLTLEQHLKLFKKQNGVCAICKRPPTGDRFRTLAVDHCHTTGEVRGFVCVSCNRAIGLLQDKVTNMTAAAQYLKKFNRRPHTN